MVLFLQISNETLFHENSDTACQVFFFFFFDPESRIFLRVQSTGYPYLQRRAKRSSDSCE